jgi:hypothetical protein
MHLSERHLTERHLTERHLTERHLTERHLTERQAAARLAPVGVTYRQARQVFAAGLAGAPLDTTTATLYDEDTVTRLAARPVLTDEQLTGACPFGLFVARAAPEVWRFAPTSSVWINTRIERHGALPFVTTVCGFVVKGAEITRTVPVRGGGYQLELRDPADWFEQLRDHRLLTGRGRPWVLLGWHGFSPELRTVGNLTP